MADTSIQLPVSPSGLRNGGIVTIVTVDNTTWTALPPTTLLNRNAMAILNRSGQGIVLNYDNSTVGFVGVPIASGGERQYDITDAIVIYCKSELSSCTVIVEEIS